ncbi:MAG: type I glutamate--ammonia ligase [Chloroflexi bacterium]|jgi:glutamine synthetase|nr:MAG: glutamine synthetase, type I [Chloroflexi bacterium OLB13]MBC6957583.1 type I glutamate--ammonia ligase [Chloroflexota bacterium]MBV6438221.1 Glutamine synthetase [Anaerolineae bacterium]MDL1917411.1 type I glutamate--ammonia ligase [Anaerolineae bacterium CFX4]OQY80524.1 MAG: type I glutamate--ammonia ligase [Anaerolineae bacterium UTCFX5]
MADYLVPAEAQASPEALLKWARANGIEEIDVRFPDVRGIIQHFSLPLGGVDEGNFEEGFGFDGSSIKGFQSIDKSDLVLFADLSTAFIDPFMKRKTLAFYTDIHEPAGGPAYGRDPRAVAKRAEAYLKTTGIADTAYFGPEAEFFVFSNVRYKVDHHVSYYEVDSHEAFWNTDSPQPSTNYLNRLKEGYFPLPPLDKLHDLRAEMAATMIACGIDIEVHHHEVAAAGQCEIDMRFDTLTSMADKLTKYKHIVKNVAAAHGLIATFMPKPIFADNGSGMHVHQSLWKDGKPLFFGDGYANLSDTALYYIGGILKHAPAILAFAAPSTNSYRRLVPGYEAPVNLVYSSRNRSAAIRIPAYSKNPKAKRLEARFPDPMANPYYTFPALMLAGLDGIMNKIHPGEPADFDVFEAHVKTPTVPGSLHGALEALEADHDFLLAGGVFTKDILESYVAYKRVHEADAVAMRPHPYEYVLYFDH